MKILLVDDESELRELVSLFLEGQFRAEVHQASCGDEAIQFLKSDRPVDLVISDYNMPNGNGGDLFRFLQTHKGGKIPFILCSARDEVELMRIFPSSEVAGIIVKPDIIAPLKEIIDGLNLNEGPTVSEGVEEYSPLRVRSAMKLGRLLFDLYIKLPAGKFIKVANRGDEFDAGDVRRFDLKKVEFLYMRRSDCTQLIHLLTDRLTQLAEAAQMDEPELVDALNTSLEAVGQAVQDLRIDESTEKLIRATLKATLKMIRKNPRLDKLFEIYAKDAGSRYISSHSLAIAHLACAVASAVGWKAEPTFSKLALASLAHDITLKNDALARVQTLADLSFKQEGFSKAEIDAYMNHPEAASALVAQITELPSDVSVVVAQHHERPDGTGFPRQLDYNRLSQLSAVMIVAHELYSYYSEDGTRKTMNAFLSTLDQSWRKGNFAPVVAAMERVGV